MRAFCMLTKVPSTLSTPVGIPRAIPTLYACRARVPAPVPMIVVGRPRVSPVSPRSGEDARRAGANEICPYMDRIEFQGFLLLKWRFQVSVALLSPGAKTAEHALLHPLRDIVAGEPL